MDEKTQKPRSPLVDLHELGIEQIKAAEDRLTFGEQLHQNLAQARAEEDQSVFAAISQSENMLKCGSRECAEAFARERRRPYGHSVIDGKWYVGTIKQLLAIGCLRSIIDPYLEHPPVGAETVVWYGTGHDLPMGPIAVVIEERDEAMNLVQARVTCRSWLERHGLSAMRIAARVYAAPHRLPEDSYGWFADRVEQWQGIPTAEAEVSTFNLRGVTKMQLSGVVVAQDETQTVTPECINQMMTNTSTLPTISKEELALLKAADEMFNGLSSDWEDEKAAYRIAEANFMATRKEF